MSAVREAAVNQREGLSAACNTFLDIRHSILEKDYLALRCIDVPSIYLCRVIVEGQNP
jgi:hypothetical protein